GRPAHCAATRTCCACIWSKAVRPYHPGWHTCRPSIFFVSRAMQPWQDIISELDLAVYERAGFGQPSGMGRRPALLVIDTQYRTVGTEPRPILESMNEYPTSCGDTGWTAIGHIARLIE